MNTSRAQAFVSGENLREGSFYFVSNPAQGEGSPAILINDQNMTITSIMCEPIAETYIIETFSPQGFNGGYMELKPLSEKEKALCEANDMNPDICWGVHRISTSEINPEP